MDTIEVTSPEAAAEAFGPPVPRRRRRTVTTPADPVLSSRFFMLDKEMRLGVSVMFGGKAFIGSVATTGGQSSAQELADLLEGLAREIRRGT